MEERKQGRGKLRPASTGSGNEFEVFYDIGFTTILRAVRPGFPPVAKVKAIIYSLIAGPGTAIPEGDYILEDADP
jgi:hypothetical protein